MTAMRSQLLTQRLPNFWVHSELKFFLTDQHTLLPSKPWLKAPQRQYWFYSWICDLAQAFVMQFGNHYFKWHGKTSSTEYGAAFIRCLTGRCGNLHHINTTALWRPVRYMCEHITYVSATCLQIPQDSSLPGGTKRQWELAAVVCLIVKYTGNTLGFWRSHFCYRQAIRALPVRLKYARHRHFLPASYLSLSKTSAKLTKALVCQHHCIHNWLHWQ